MLFLQTDNENNIVKWPLSDVEVRQLLSNISLPEDLTSVDLKLYNIRAVDVAKPPTQSADKRVQLAEPKYDKKTDTWIRQFKVIDRTDVEIATGWKRIRKVRDQRLAATDWTQVSDAPLTKAKVAEFKTYRQALRDITQTFDSPFKVVWPTKPE